MNEVLPKFYEAWYSRCKGAREFVKLFHSEGRCQYERHQRVLKLFSTADAILSNRNPGAKGTFFDDNMFAHIIRPIDTKRKYTKACLSTRAS